MGGYIGITIGPILDTLMLARSPARMWYASSIFSELTETICENIVSDMPESKILSPYYSEVKYTDGIGRYHDRIIIENGDKDKISDIISKSISSVAMGICEDISGMGDRGDDADFEYIKNYFQVHYVYLPEIEEGESIALTIDDMLDALEQMVSPNADNTNNPFLKIFNGKEFTNRYVRNRLSRVSEKSQLKNENNMLKSIQEIVSAAGVKNLPCYAVVEADADGMGKYIRKLDNEKLYDFSKRCFDYTSKAAKLIGDYGGMTVYAGGDDLLFIAPVRSGDMTVYELCNEISKVFKSTVCEDNGDGMAVSFGICIRRLGFPLYESLSSSIASLYMAKSEMVGHDAMVIDYYRSNDWAARLAVPFDKYDLFVDTINMPEGVDMNAVRKVFNANNILLEAAHTSRQMIKNVITNAFDSFARNDSGGILRSVSDKAYNFIAGNSGQKIFAFDNKNHIYSDMQTYETMLRFSYMMLEGGEEE